MTTDLSNLRTVVIDGSTWLFADVAPKIALSKDGPDAADPVVWALAVAALTDGGADS